MGESNGQFEHKVPATGREYDLNKKTHASGQCSAQEEFASQAKAASDDKIVNSLHVSERILKMTGRAD